MVNKHKKKIHPPESRQVLPTDSSLSLFENSVWSCLMFYILKQQ